MWPSSYDQRLREWRDLRDSASVRSIPGQLAMINDWWWQAPIRARDIHWPDWTQWPDPWQILQQDGYSDLARALGIVYTMLMIDPGYGSRTRLVQDPEANLVLVDGDKYILNWCPGQIVNIRSHPISIIQEVSAEQLTTKTGEQ